MHTQRVCKDFETKMLAGYHDLYLKSDTLLLDDVFEKASLANWLSVSLQTKYLWVRIPLH